MALGSTPHTNDLTWAEAFRDYLESLAARNRAEKTVHFYRVQLRQLIRWADEEGVSFAQFGKRHMNRYLKMRRESVSRTTLWHDGVAAVAFFKWCARNDYLDHNPLADYEVTAAPRPPKYVPTDEEIRGLLKGLERYWNPEYNPGMKNIPQSRRRFHRERNRAVVLMLLDTAARIGEVGNLKLDDYRAKEMEITIRESKGKQPRTLPLSPGTVDAVTNWLKVRDRLMAEVLPENDEGWLFLSEYGTQMDLTRFGKATKGVLRWAQIKEFTLHDLRHYSLTRLAKTNRVVAQQIAGHKDPRTTDIYIHLDADYTRQVHAEVGIVDNVLENRRLAHRKRLA
jgi:integrase/recombinase XerD